MLPAAALPASPWSAVHPPLRHYAPELVVNRLEAADQQRSQGDRAVAQRGDPQVAPPGGRLGIGANGHAGEAAAPVLVYVRPQLVAGEPLDLVLLDAVVDFFALERDAVRRAGNGALA